MVSEAVMSFAASTGAAMAPGVPAVLTKFPWLAKKFPKVHQKMIWAVKEGKKNFYGSKMPMGMDYDALRLAVNEALVAMKTIPGLKQAVKGLERHERFLKRWGKLSSQKFDEFFRWMQGNIGL